MIANAHAFWNWKIDILGRGWMTSVRELFFFFFLFSMFMYVRIPASKGRGENIIKRAISMDSTDILEFNRCRVGEISEAIEPTYTR